MKRKTIGKVLGAGMLALTVLVSPLAGTYAWAAEAGETQEATEGTESTVKEGGSVKGLDPMQDEEIPAVGTEGEEGYVPAKPAYADVEIPVWGFTEDATVYSVDVEWGAMTFQWENSSWDPETHMKKTGAGWKVYDSAKNKALDATEDLINEIKVTNHSNAGVWATLSYTNDDGKAPDTTGDFSFTKGTAEGDTDVLTAAGTDVPAYLTLETADNNLGEGEGVGKETVGKAYFMPDGLNTDTLDESGIAKWTTIGKITVGIKTEVPAASTETEPEVTEP